MAIRVRVPLIGRLVIVQSLSELQQINQSPDVSRSLAEARGLLAAWLRRAFERDLRFGAVLHVFRPRADAARAADQHVLEQRLSILARDPDIADEDLTPVRQYVRGAGSREQAARAIQQIVGRAFCPGYRASGATSRAARTLDGWARAPWRAASGRITGRLARAKSSIGAQVADDLLAIHATSIAMQNIVRSLERLRERYRGGDRAPLRDADLAAPALIVRAAIRKTTFPFLSGVVEAGTLFVVPLDRLHQREPAPELVFLARQWSRCPAHRYVPGLLAAIWEDATAGTLPTATGTRG